MVQVTKSPLLLYNSDGNMGNKLLPYSSSGNAQIHETNILARQNFNSFKIEGAEFSTELNLATFLIGTYLIYR